MALKRTSNPKTSHNAIIESWDRGAGVARDLYTGKALKVTDAQIIPRDKPHTVVVGQHAVLDFGPDKTVRSITLLPKKKRTKVAREQTQEKDVNIAVSIATSGLATGIVSGVKLYKENRMGNTQNPQLLSQGYEGSVDLRPIVDAEVEGSTIINTNGKISDASLKPTPDPKTIVPAPNAPGTQTIHKNPA